MNTESCHILHCYIYLKNELNPNNVHFYKFKNKILRQCHNAIRCLDQGAIFFLFILKIFDRRMRL